MDGSEGARRAVCVAIDLAQRLLTALTVVTVSSGESDANDALALAVAEAETWHDRIETVMRSGDTAAELAEAARERQAPLLVLGSRGHGALRAALVGSVSAAATRLAPCPVVIVPPQATITRYDDGADLARP